MRVGIFGAGQAGFCPGYFPESLINLGNELPRFAFVSLDLHGSAVIIKP